MSAVFRRRSPQLFHTGSAGRSGQEPHPAEQDDVVRNEQGRGSSDRQPSGTGRTGRSKAAREPRTSDAVDS